MSSGESFRAPKGTQDVFGPESARWERLLVAFADTVESAGYGLIQSPMFEDIGVFRRLGEETDVVTKEMYDFVDKGDRHIALRPEGTASVVRAFVQHHPVTPVEDLVRHPGVPLRVARRAAGCASTTRSASRRSARPIPTSTSRSSRSATTTSAGSASAGSCSS